MPQIKPFRAYLYNSMKVDLGDVVAPPYDVISPSQQADLYANSPHNCVRLILNRDVEKYISAAQFYEEWKKKKILLRDARPAIYVLSQRYKTPDGKSHERKGFIAACRLEEIGKGSILPHERTLSKPKADRLELFKSTGAMFSQIFGIYADPNGVIDAVMKGVMHSIAVAEFTFEHVENKLWVLRDQSLIQSVTEYIKRQKILVADGHHRYETALLYRDFMRSQSPKYTGEEPFNFVPMYLTNMHAPGLAILPTHRLIHSLSKFDQAQMMENLGKRFQVIAGLTKEKMLEELHFRKTGAFGVVLTEPPNFSIICRDPPKEGTEISTVKFVDTLDVSILHREIIGNILGITEEQQLQKTNLDYEKDAEAAIEAVKVGTAQAAFLMNPTMVEDVRKAAEAGDVMPQKSTYFYPKLVSGLVNYSFTEE